MTHAILRQVFRTLMFWGAVTFILSSHPVLWAFARGY